MNKHKIYTIDYLINEDLTEEDLYYLFNTDSLNYSLIIAMFNTANINKSNKCILQLITKDNDWVNTNYWSNKQLNTFEELLKQVYINLYQVKEYTAKCYAQMWIIKYGLANNSIRNKKITNKNSLYI